MQKSIEVTSGLARLLVLIGAASLSVKEGKVEMTEEQMSAIGDKVGDYEAQNAQTLAALYAAQKERDEAKATVVDLKSKLANAEKERDEAQALAEKYGAKAAETKSKPKSRGVTPPADEEDDDETALYKMSDADFDKAFASKE